jgi:hypothetical protein
VDRLQRFELVVPRPGWLTAGAVKLGLLSLFVVLVAMLRPRLTPGNAGWVTLAGAFAAVVGAACFLVVTRRIALQLPLPARSGAGEAATFAPGRLRRAYAAGRTERVTDAVFVVLRRMGLPLLGLAFFLVWTFVYIAVWWAHPEDAFRGLEPNPRFADFFYTAVSTAFVSPPGDIVAHSRGARAATIIEMLTAVALAGTYLSSFVDWHRRSDSEHGRQILVAPPGEADQH